MLELEAAIMAFLRIGNSLIICSLTIAAVVASTTDAVPQESQDEAALSVAMFVDAALEEDCFGNYNITSRSCTGTDGYAFSTLKKGAGALGVISSRLLVREGVYRESVAVNANGTAVRRLYLTNFPGEEPIIDGEYQRENCVVLGSTKSPHGGHYVTIEGLTCRNITSITGSSGGILVVGTMFAEIRKNHIYNTGPLSTKVPSPGIRVISPGQYTLVEYNHVHHIGGGIGTRYTDGDYPGAPSFPTIRGNYVHHIQMECENEPGCTGASCCDQQNYAAGIVFSSQTMHGLAEHNVVHHTMDIGIGTYETGGNIVRYNVAYLTDIPKSGGGNGAGIKIFPSSGPYVLGPDYVHHNISFFNRFRGVEFSTANVFGILAYHNLIYRTFTIGVSGTVNGTHFMNSASFANTFQDIKGYSAPNSLVYSNYLSPEHLESHFPHLGLLNINLNPSAIWPEQGCVPIATDIDGDCTPNILEPLNFGSCDQGVQCLMDAEEAVGFARQRMSVVFTPSADSSLPNSGSDLSKVLPPGLQKYVDFLGNSISRPKPDRGATERP